MHTQRTFIFYFYRFHVSSQAEVVKLPNGHFKKMRVLVILLDLVSISETQEPAVINDIARDSKLWLLFVLIGYRRELD